MAIDCGNSEMLTRVWRICSVAKSAGGRDGYNFESPSVLQTWRSKRADETGAFGIETTGLCSMDAPTTECLSLIGTVCH